jgi:transposase-like protein
MGTGRTDEFCKDTVRIALTSGLTRRQVADDLGVGLSTLNKWVAAYCDTDLVSLKDRELARENEQRLRESFLEAFLHLVPNVAEARRATRRHAERGLELDPLDPFANFTMGRGHWLTNDLDVAAEWLDRATRLNPNYAQGFYSSTLTSMLTGNVAATKTELDMALQLSPLDPLLYGIHGVRSQLFMQTGVCRCCPLGRQGGQHAQRALLDCHDCDDGERSGRATRTGKALAAYGPATEA